MHLCRAMADFLARAFSLPPVVAVLPLAGVIAPRAAMLGRQPLSVETLGPTISRAFRLRRLAGVALVVNSPGGSAAQSALIAARIRQHAEERKVPVTAFVEDVAASGGYWLACAADEILCLETSLLGSIGVISAGFGFAGLMERIGVERRLYTAGEKKSLLDPFRPAREDDVARLRAIQEALHGRFKAWVRDRRGQRLRAEESELFSGEIWAGERAVALGLADGFGELRATMRARHGERVRFAVFGRVRRPWWSRLLPTPEGLIAAAEERAAWARFGL
ncbi:S49 family peptidase [Elioraea sp. Yellowstone]|jgi:signal peptide peptidase SppA|uniref:S49 family peptidase n=1 Tax=Elioraea sp. Yellowstone TaxID=2592070 RepID=UPI001F3A4EBB|nr:S49 family peptidase [Elioraea sp. Yellowstone]